MGSFRGHALPGTFFIFFSIWQAVDIYRRYFRSIRDPQRDPYRSRASIPCCGGRVPLEAIIKVAATSFGILGEAYTGFDGHGNFTHIHNGQHITMFAFFTLNGIVDLIYFFGLPAVPKQLDYLSAILAFAIEGLLFMWHLHGRPPMDVQVHTFLTYVIAMCIVSGFIEMLAPNDVRPAIIRAGFTFLQGTWFWQVGQILYPKFGRGPWNQEDHTQMMIVTMMFSWHVAFAVLFMAVLGMAVYCCSNRSGCCCCRKSKASSKPLSSSPTLGSTEYKRLAENEDVAMNMFSDDEEV